MKLRRCCQHLCFCFVSCIFVNRVSVLQLLKFTASVKLSQTCDWLFQLNILVGYFSFVSCIFVNHMSILQLLKFTASVKLNQTCDWLFQLNLFVGYFSCTLWSAISAVSCDSYFSCTLWLTVSAVSCASYFSCTLWLSVSAVFCGRYFTCVLWLAISAVPCDWLLLWGGQRQGVQHFLDNASLCADLATDRCGLRSLRRTESESSWEGAGMGWG